MIRRFFVQDDGVVLDDEKVKAKQKENLNQKLAALAFNVAIKLETQKEDEDTTEKAG